jgi:hypothetical protein
MIFQQPFHIFPFTPFLLPRHPITQQPAKSRVRSAARLECGILREARSLLGKPIALMGLFAECQFRLEYALFASSPSYHSTTCQK